MLDSDLSPSIRLVDIVDDPSKFGAPTYDEFCSNPEKWRQRKDWLFAEVDRGSQMLDRHVESQEYEILGYRVKTLEKVEQIALDNGINPWTLNISPEIEPTAAGKCKIIVRFRRNESPPTVD